jgi:hypothetical protein
MRIRVCYLDCHEAGLWCYLVIHIISITAVLLPFVTYLLTLSPSYTGLQPETIVLSDFTTQKTTLLSSLAIRISNRTNGAGCMSTEERSCNRSPQAAAGTYSCSSPTSALCGTERHVWRIWGSDVSGYEVFYLLGYSALLGVYFTLLSYFTYPSTLIMEEKRSYETLVASQRTIRL